MPASKVKRYVEQLGLSKYDALLLTGDKELARYFDEAVAYHSSPKKIANWITTELLGRINQDGIALSAVRIAPQQLAKLVSLIDQGTINGKTAKELFDSMYQSGADPSKLMVERGLTQISDAAIIETAIDRVLAVQQKNVAAYKAGKTTLLGFFVGQVMKSTQGRANPKIVNELLQKKLKS